MPDEPALSRPWVRRPEAVALVLHGGREHGTDPVPPLASALLRMVPVARDLEARSRGRIGAALLRYRVRGWNEELRSPLEDARWALRRLRATYPQAPIGLVGHSMGGRVALELAGDPDVSSVVALAPWVGERYDGAGFARTPVLVVHGRRDTVTRPRSSASLVRRIDAAGGRATFVDLDDGHAMLRHAPTWHRLASRFTAQMLLPSHNATLAGR